ncbi:MAG: 23S rRNA (pseudouridine(1915)-N(3))-methyltransferase RlmH [Myxococcota bacterium]
MIRLAIAIVGKSRCAWADSAVDDYGKRLKRHGKLEERIVKPERFHGDVDAVRTAEGERLLKVVGPRESLVALDERGERLDSHGFAAMLDALNLEGTVVFAIGGAYGLAPEVRAVAARTVRVSDLVLNHEVARVVLYEQLYRAVTINAGIPYHH